MHRFLDFSDIFCNHCDEAEEHITCTVFGTYFASEELSRVFAMVG